MLRKAGSSRTRNGGKGEACTCSECNRELGLNRSSTRPSRYVLFNPDPTKCYASKQRPNLRANSDTRAVKKPVKDCRKKEECKLRQTELENGRKTAVPVRDLSSSENSTRRKKSYDLVEGRSKSAYGRVTLDKCGDNANEISDEPGQPSESAETERTEDCDPAVQGAGPDAEILEGQEKGAKEEEETVEDDIEEKAKKAKKKKKPASKTPAFGRQDAIVRHMLIRGARRPVVAPPANDTWPGAR